MSTSDLRVAIYARVSSDQQAESGTILSQIEELKSRVQADGFVLEDESCFLDDGYTGSSLIRPGLERLRDAAAAGVVDRLYVHSPDRLARNYAHQVLLVEELSGCGVEIVFLNHQIGETPEQKLLLQVQGIIAEYERWKILERGRRGRLSAARRGSVSVLAGAPYGYRYITTGAGGGTGEYQVVLEEARVVRKIFEWVGQDRLSIHQVAKRLDREGIPTAKGRSFWNRSTVWGILKNPAYKGTAAFGRRRSGERRARLRPWRGATEQPRRPSSTYAVEEKDWIYIQVPAIVSEELFQGVKEQLEENRQRMRERPRRRSYLLSGLLVCEECGYALSGYMATRRSRKGEKRRYPYYKCTGRDGHRFGGHRLCWSPPVRADFLEESVWADVQALLSEPDRIKAEFERRLHGDTNLDGSEILKDLERQIQKVKRSTGRLIDAYAEGYLEKEEFELRMRKARERLERLQTELKEKADEQSHRKEIALVVARFEEFCERVKQGLQEEDWEIRRDIVRRLIKRIEVNRERVRIVYRVDPSPQPGPSGSSISSYCPKRAAHALPALRRGEASPLFLQGEGPLSLLPEEARPPLGGEDGGGGPPPGALRATGLHHAQDAQALLPLGPLPPRRPLPRGLRLHAGALPGALPRAREGSAGHGHLPAVLWISPESSPASPLGLFTRCLRPGGEVPHGG